LAPRAGLGVLDGEKQKLFMLPEIELPIVQSTELFGNYSSNSTDNVAACISANQLYKYNRLQTAESSRHTLLLYFFVRMEGYCHHWIISWYKWRNLITDYCKIQNRSYCCQVWCVVEWFSLAERHAKV
jgi:hypothetical protein